MRLLGGGDARAERLRSAVMPASTPPARLVLLAGLCSALWLLSGSSLWRGGVLQQQLSSAEPGCAAAAAIDDGTPMLPARIGVGREAGDLRPWVQHARDEMAGLTEHVVQLRCGHSCRSLKEM